MGDFFVDVVNIQPSCTLLTDVFTCLVEIWVFVTVAAEFSGDYATLTVLHALSASHTMFQRGSYPSSRPSYHPFWMALSFSPKHLIYLVENPESVCWNGVEYGEGVTGVRRREVQ